MFQGILNQYDPFFSWTNHSVFNQSISLSLSQVRGLDDGVVGSLAYDDGGGLLLEGDALGAAGELPAQRERVHEPHLERLLRDDQEVAVAEAVQQLQGTKESGRGVFNCPNFYPNVSYLNYVRIKILFMSITTWSEATLEDW